MNTIHSRYPGARIAHSTFPSMLTRREATRTNTSERHRSIPANAVSSRKLQPFGFVVDPMNRCSKCTDRLEQERLKRLARLPGADRATRMDDISSDEDDVSVFPGKA